MSRIYSILFVLLTSTVLTNCNNPNSVDAYMQGLAAKGQFNGNILVVKNGETLYENSFGFADGAKTTKLTSQYRFGLGSVYKEFPAVSIMQLQEKGLLHTDDKIDRYIKNLPSWASKISIKNLLQYTSGLPKVAWEKYLDKNEIITDAKLQNDLLHIDKLSFNPGEDYEYTNYSPMLLAKIVENITKQTFTAYVTQNLFIPFSLDTAVIPEEVPFLNKNLVAIPFNENYEEDSWKIKLSGVIFIFSARDLYNWIEHLHAYHIISKESMKFLSEEADFFGNIQAPLGSVTWDNDILVAHTHHGENGNYECIVKRIYTNTDVWTIIVQSNQKRGNVYEIPDEIHSILN